MQSIRNRYQQQGFSDQAASLIISSWRLTTQSAYNCYITKWKQYASENSINLMSPSPVEVANFVAKLFAEGASHSAVNTARSALSAFLPRVDGRSMGSHPDVCRIVKGVFEERPSLPRYSDTWDVNVVLQYLSSLPDVNDLSLKELTLRMCMLLALVTGQRGQALHLLKVSDLRFCATKCTILYSEKHKQSRPGFHTDPTDIMPYNRNQKLCLLAHLRRYLVVTKELRDPSQKQLLLSYVKPHVPISRQTFSRWIKCVLSAAGVKTETYGSHSTRAASCSAAAKAGVSLAAIMKAAGWSNDCTFAKFYRKNTTQNFGQMLLDNFLKDK